MSKTKIGVREVIDEDLGVLKYLPYIYRTGWFGITKDVMAVVKKERRDDFLRYHNSPFHNSFKSDTYDSEADAIKAAENHLLWYVKQMKWEEKIKDLEKQCKTKNYDFSDDFLDRLDNFFEKIENL